MNILMLGAGKRLSLAEHFQRAAQLEDITLNLFSIELHEQVAIASVAKVFQGPLFDSPAFPSFLWCVVESQAIDAVIPLMDSATVALSALAEDLPCTSVVSDADLCITMQDKLLADDWFRWYNVPVPTSKWDYPRIYKPRRGYGSRGVIIARNEYNDTLQDNKDYFAQPYITSGVEYTVDAYVNGKGRLVSALSRKRVEVINGEVTHSITQRHEGILALTRDILSIPGWRGPITLQFMDIPTGPVILEINPRFGGGAPHSIHLGLDAPRWILREALGRCVEPVEAWPDGSVMVRCLRDVYL
jgi:carbamoyl-phosphate synthase large subunit